MAEIYSFFNAVVDEAGLYDREYLAEDFAKYFSSFIGNGVYANPASNLQVKSKGNMAVEVSAGSAWINGYYYQNTTPKVINLDLADGATERIDRIVVRLSLINRKITTEVKKGIGSSVAIAPTVSRTADIYELALADIKVKKNVVAVSQADITDLRMDKKLCGIVHGTIEQLDTTDMFAQYDKAFEVWFEQMKGQLSEDAAGKLQIQITELQNKTSNINNTADRDKNVNGLIDKMGSSDFPLLFASKPRGFSITDAQSKYVMGFNGPTRITCPVAYEDLRKGMKIPKTIFGTKKINLVRSSTNDYQGLLFSYEELQKLIGEKNINNDNLYVGIWDGDGSTSHYRDLWVTDYINSMDSLRGIYVYSNTTSRLDNVKIRYMLAYKDFE